MCPTVAGQGGYFGTEFYIYRSDTPLHHTRTSGGSAAGDTFGAHIADTDGGF